MQEPANGNDRKDGGAVWKTYPFEFRLPFAEIDTLRLTVGFRGGAAATAKEAAFSRRWRFRRVSSRRYGMPGTIPGVSGH